MTSAKLKMAARKKLNGNYLVIISSLLLFVLIGWDCLLVADLIEASWLAPILTIIVCSSLIMGFVGMILKVSRGKKINFVDIFDRTDLLIKYIGLTVILFLVGLLAWVLEFLAFKSLIIIMLYQTELNAMLSVLLINFGMLLSTAILLVSIYIAISFSQSYFILYDEPNLKITRVLGKSFDMMGNYILEYFVLALSFIGWIILGLFTFCLLYIWLIPYMLVTFANFYNVVRKDYEATSGDADGLALEAAEKKEVKSTKTSGTKRKSTKTSTTAKKNSTTTKKASTTTKKKVAQTGAKKTTSTRKSTAKTSEK